MNLTVSDLGTLLLLVGGGIGVLIAVWALVRVASLAFFKSRRDFDEGNL